MNAAHLLWFFAWRTACWGAALCALLGAAYPVLGMAIFSVAAEGPDDGTQLGAGLAYLFFVALLFGILSAAMGSVLGLLCGLALFGLTKALFPRPADLRRYRGAAGRTCAATTALALLTDWFVSGYPNLENFGLLRLVGNSGVPPEPSASGVLLFVVVPTLLLALTMRAAGRIVADRYGRRVVEANRAG